MYRGLPTLKALLAVEVKVSLAPVTVSSPADCQRLQPLQSTTCGCTSNAVCAADQLREAQGHWCRRYGTDAFARLTLAA